MALGQQLKKGVFSKGVLAEIACNNVLPLLGCAQRLHKSSARRRLVQNFAWCAKWATRRENPKLQNWNEESAVQRGVCSALCTSGVCGKLAAKFPTFSDIFRIPYFTVLDVQDVRNTISDNFRILPKIFRKFPHCGGRFEGLRGAGFWNLVWGSRSPFRASRLNTNARRAATGSKRRGT